MILNKSKTVAKLFFAAVFFLFTAVQGCKTLGTNNAEKISSVSYLYPGDMAMWKHIFKLSEPYVLPQRMPSTIIIPHHDITSPNQNSFYRALSKLGNPSTVVIIAPDHYEKGSNLISLPCNTSFDSPDGIFTIDEETRKGLTVSCVRDFIDETSEPWPMEHGIYIHTPFIRHYFPEAKLLPVLLKSFSEAKDFEIYEKLGQVLNELLDEDALVIASVDFSHYQIPRMTELHDIVSMNTIQNGENLQPIEVDSPESLTVATTFARCRGKTVPVLIDRTSTFDFIPDENIVSTSHQYWTFYAEEDKKIVDDFYIKAGKSRQRINTVNYKDKKNQTILIGGSGNLGTGIQTYWRWDRYKTSSERKDLILGDMAGNEARFFNGFDACIFDVKPGEKFSQKKHGTNLVIQGCNYGEETGYAGLIKKEESPTINILVSCYDGQDTSDFPADILLNKYDIAVLRCNSETCKSYTFLEENGVIRKIDLGILYSETGKETAGTILCINWSNGKKSVELFPFESKNGHPPAIFQGEI